MIIQNLVDDFYKQLNPTKPVLILCGLDVDAMSAVRTLMAMFQADLIKYRLKPIKTRSELCRTLYEEKANTDQFILLNLGATVEFFNIGVDGFPLPDDEDDLVKPLLEDDDRVTLFIIDSHRPINLVNVFSDLQLNSRIYVHVAQDEIETIPLHEEVFGSDDESESEDEDNLVDRMARREERRNKDKIREDRIGAYEEYTYTGPSTAITFFELSQKLSKDSVSTLWWGIIGITDQFVSGRVRPDQYTANVYKHALHQHSQRLQSRSEANNRDVLLLEPLEDLQLPLYRHWNISEALTHSLPVASAIKVWTGSGARKIKELVAQIGLPLTQASEKYHYMEERYKSEFPRELESKAPNFGIKNLRILAFTAQRGFGYKYTAADTAIAINAMLELAGAQDPLKNFEDALEALRTEAPTICRMQDGIELAKGQLRAILNTLNSQIETNNIINAGPFLYMNMKESPDNHMFAHPVSIRLLSAYLLHSFCRSQPKQRREKIRGLPLVLAAPRGDSAPGKKLVCGCPPLGSTSNKNPFGKAFREAGHRSHSRIDYQFMDDSLLQIDKDDFLKFMEALVVELSMD